MSSLNGAQVVLLEGRMPGELADLVRRHGGEPRCVPAVREQPLEIGDQVSAFIDTLVVGMLPVVVCLTGVGVKTLFQQAECLGRLPELLAALREVTVVCRGHKPSAVLRGHGVPVALSAPPPYTTQELLDVMKGLDLKDAGVALLHYGEHNAALAEALQVRGAHVHELLLYQWLLPEDHRPLQSLVDDILASRVQAIAFTSQIQVRHLFQIAADMEKRADLIHALKNNVVVASVGPVCTAVLQEMGVTPHVVPNHPKMGPMISSLAHFMEREYVNLRKRKGTHDS
jgi:uroporphyrinogen-III synthase